MTAHAQGTLRPDVTSHDHIRGPANAPVTLVEYGDYQCPHCYRAHPVVAKLRQEMGEQLRFVFRNFPLTQAHPEALHAAEAAESVAAHAGIDAFWLMHDAIYHHQQDSEYALDDAHLIRYAVECGADASVITADLENDTFEDRVRADFTSGVRSGVNGTPTFFINGVRFDGDWTQASGFLEALRAAAS